MSTGRGPGVTSLLVLIPAFLPGAWAGCGTGAEATVSIERQGQRVAVFDAERAVTADERRRGLQGHAPLDPDQALLIEMPIVTETCIVNNGVDFAIDAIYAGQDGAVVAVERGIPAGSAEARCYLDVYRVVETAAGAASEVVEGDRVVVEYPPG